MKTTKVILITLAVIISVPLIGRLIWSLQKGKKIDLMIVNKTVPSVSKNEVKSLNWVLNECKILKSSNVRYNYMHDYYGYHPEDNDKGHSVISYKLEEIDGFRDKYECLLFLDNKGVAGTEHDNDEGYFGGFNQNDYLLLKNMISNNKLIVAECDFFSETTEDLVRYNTQNLIDVYHLGWRGKYFKDLSNENLAEEIGSEWMDYYKEYENTNWAFEGPGLAFINEKQHRIVVIPAKEYMIRKFPSVITSAEFAEQMNVPERTAYTGWFYMVYPGKNIVISSFDMNLNPEGEQLLRSNGLTGIFPATIKSANDKFYFIAGDFSKQNVNMASSRIRIVNDVIMRVYGNMTETPGKFFQTYYVPFMSEILENYYKEKTQVQAMVSE